jgi:hypothetical protein
VGPTPRNLSESDISGFQRIEYRDFRVRGQSCMLLQLMNSRNLTSQSDIGVSEFQDSRV